MDGVSDVFSSLVDPSRCGEGTRPSPYPFGERIHPTSPFPDPTLVPRTLVVPSLLASVLQTPSDRRRGTTREEYQPWFLWTSPERLSPTSPGGPVRGGRSPRLVVRGTAVEMTLRRPTLETGRPPAPPLGTPIPRHPS